MRLMTLFTLLMHQNSYFDFGYKLISVWSLNFNADDNVESRIIFLEMEGDHGNSIVGTDLNEGNFVSLILEGRSLH